MVEGQKRERHELKMLVGGNNRSHVPTRPPPDDQTHTTNAFCHRHTRTGTPPVLIKIHWELLLQLLIGDNNDFLSKI